MGGTVHANEQCPTTTFIAAAQPLAARTSRGEDWRGMAVLTPPELPVRGDTKGGSIL